MKKVLDSYSFNEDKDDYGSRLGKVYLYVLGLDYHAEESKSEKSKDELLEENDEVYNL